MLLTQQRSDGFSAHCEISICVQIDLVYSFCRNYSRWSRSHQQPHRREPLSPSGSRSSERSPVFVSITGKEILWLHDRLLETVTLSSERRRETGRSSTSCAPLPTLTNTWSARATRPSRKPECLRSAGTCVRAWLTDEQDAVVLLEEDFRVVESL